MSKELHPENNCENCFRKKYCGKPCRVKKNYQNYLVMKGLNKVKALNPENGFTSGYLTTEEDDLKYQDVKSFTTAISNN